uniref:Secreted protein n=1 Tax=Steinernema glaseri TaxID=37863 RepID=A0A1I7ZZA7_9BILA
MMSQIFGLSLPIPPSLPLITLVILQSFYSRSRSLRTPVNDEVVYKVPNCLPVVLSVCPTPHPLLVSRSRQPRYCLTPPDPPSLFLITICSPSPTTITRIFRSFVHSCS